MGDKTHNLGPAEDQGKAAWSLAVSLLTRNGVAERNARTFFGKLLKSYGIQAHEMLLPLQAAERSGTGDPVAYLAAAANGVRNSKIDPALKASWT